MRIRYAPVPPALRAPVRTGRLVEAGKGKWLLRLTSDVRILATGGRLITVDAPKSVQDNEIAAWVQGPATIAVLYQRGLTPLHASAVMLGGEIVAFLGPSGMGKTSLASAFVAAGAHFVTDDVLVVTGERPGRLRGLPGPTLLRLHPSMGERLGWRGVRFLRQDHDGKSLVEPRERTLADSAPVGALFVLGLSETFAIEQLRGIELLDHLRGLVQRPKLASALGAEGAVFGVIDRLVREVPAWHLVRPAAAWTLPDCSASIRRVLTESGILC